MSSNSVVIILVIDKSDSRFATSDFVNHSYDFRSNWTPLGLIVIINHLSYSTVFRFTLLDSFPFHTPLKECLFWFERLIWSCCIAIGSSQ